MSRVLSVYTLNRYVKELLEEDRSLAGVYVKGEISNLTIYNRSGHCYFSLKDEKAAVKAVMFKGYLSSLRFTPREGMSVIVSANATVFEGTGSYQLNVTSMIPEGEGALALQYEQLKEKLLNEGLFDIDKKKDLPIIPEHICVITSLTGAAVQDIKNVITRRFPALKLTLINSLVQGENAAKDLFNALKLAESLSPDTIIIGRGGGSREDLWCFNDEKLVRAVAGCSVPIISAVGHETDFTLCDFAADRRAATPTEAAELATPMLDTLMLIAEEKEIELERAIKRKLADLSQMLMHYEKTLSLSSPKNKLLSYKKEIINKHLILYKAVQKKLDESKAKLGARAGILNSISPLAVMERGYSYSVDEENKLINSVVNVKKGDKLTVHVRDGYMKVIVDAKRKKKENKA